ncbi:MAG: alanine racemase [Alphaproteobacteria bacterium]|nr:alanine racemase [Alphaproteobacteria bacterium]
MAAAYAQPLSVLDIHLDRVARNYLLLKKKVQAEAAGGDCAAVVKADAYGLGAAEVSRALYKQSCRHFFVAHYGEALEVKEALQGLYGVADAPSIYVLNGPFGAPAADFAANGFIPVLNSPQDIDYWAQTGQGDKRPAALLHIDTGMNRLGLSGGEVEALAARGDLSRILDIRYVMSHLACADEKDHPKNAAQLELFKQLTARLGIAARYSFANSSGIFLGPAYHFDLARPGCALYGINPGTGENPMQGTVTLKARILQTRKIDRNGTVGYGATYSVSPPAICATVSTGYADGYLRSLTGRGTVVIGGKTCPVIGRVSMDSVVVDASALDAPPRPGDWAEIIGERQTVDAVAAQAGTIGYEILTSLGRRYRRNYTGG